MSADVHKMATTSSRQSGGTAGHSLLKSLFARVITLDGFIRNLCSKSISDTLRENDKPGFVQLLHSTLVCNNSGLCDGYTGIKTRAFSVEQLSRQHEVVLRVIQKLLRRDGPGKNQLTLGYNTISEDREAQISNLVNVELFYPNPSFSLLLHSPWKILLSKVGDEVMQHLLETQTIFVNVASGCYIQITGTPVFLLPNAPNLPFLKQPGNRKKSRDHNKKGSRHVSKDLGGNGTEKPGKHQETALLSKYIVKERHNSATGHGKKRKCEEERSGPSATGHGKKRKCEEERSGPSATGPDKKRKHEEESSGPSATGHGKKRKHEEESSGPLGIGPDKKRNHEEESSGPSACSKKRKLKSGLVAMPGDNLAEHGNGEQVVPSSGGIKNCEPETKNYSDRPKASYDYHKCLPRKSAFYCKILKEQIPKNYLLKTLPDSRAGAWQLLHDMIGNYSSLFDEVLELGSQDAEYKVVQGNLVSSTSTDFTSEEGVYGEHVQVEKDPKIGHPVMRLVGLNRQPNTPSVAGHKEIGGTKSPNVVAQVGLRESQIMQNQNCVNVLNSVINCGPHRTPHVIPVEQGVCDKPRSNCQWTLKTSEDAGGGATRKGATGVEKRANAERTTGGGATREEATGVEERTNAERTTGGGATREGATGVEERANAERTTGGGATREGATGVEERANAERTTGGGATREGATGVEERANTERTTGGGATREGATGVEERANTERTTGGGATREGATGVEERANAERTTVGGATREGATGVEERANTERTTGGGATREGATGVEERANAERTTVGGATREGATGVEERANAERTTGGGATREGATGLEERANAERTTVGGATREGATGVEERANAERTTGEGATGKGTINNREGATREMHLPQLLGEFLHNHKKCRYLTLLRKHCFVELSGTKETSTLLEKHCSTFQVYLFLREACLQVLPEHLLGSSHNRNIVLNNINYFVKMGKYETLNVGQLMTGVKVTHCWWLKHIGCHGDREAVMARLLSWLLSSYICVLLKSFFYITDSTVHRNRMFYFRKIVWRLLQKRTVQGCVNKKLYKPIAKVSALQLLDKGAALGVSHVRFLPKATGLRPITNMGVKQAPTGYSTNSLLINLFQVLTYEKNRNPEILGSSKLGMNDIHCSWKQFVMDRRKLGDERELYFVKVDIKNCYNSMVRSKVFDIVSAYLNQEEEYVIRKYTTVMIVRGRPKKHFHREASSLSEFEPSFSKFVAKKLAEGKFRNCIFSDHVVHQHEIPSGLLAKLHSHLFNNIIKIGGQYYEQLVGISQGSILSTLLCSLYYGEMERKYLRIDQDELLMRQQDDFLYVTPSREYAVNFLTVMTAGIPEYNCFINTRKTMTNFDVNSCDFHIEGTPVDWFPWCGLLFHVRTLEVRMDYSRYAGLAISDTQTFSMGRHAGRSLEDKLFLGLKTKLHPMLLDSKIQSAEVIMKNTYQMALLSAFKFHACAHKLPKGCKVLHNPQFFTRVITNLCLFLWRQVQKKLTKAGCGGQGPLTKSHCRWLFLKAYLTKLSVHQGAYQAVITSLKRHLRQTGRKMAKSTKSGLEKMFGSSMPKEFQLMLN